MDSLIINIISYLKYLNGDCHLNVSVHFRQDIFNRMHENLASKLLHYNYHTNAYCVFAKKENYHDCLSNQKNILSKCQSGKPFCNICHAGVQEYIYPIFLKEEAVGFISVSGYRQSNPSKDNILNHKLWEVILKTKIPMELCSSVIPPLGIMLEAALVTYLKESCNEYSQILHFLNEYHTNITLSDLAKHFNRSKSHISHLFKNESGLSLRAHCNNLKLEDAKKLLLQTDIPITEIALNVGFNDTSYFIFLFKNKFGITPFQYRHSKEK